MAHVGDIAHDIHGRSSPRDEAIARIAARQHGVVSYAQLKAKGLRRGAIEHRLAAGRLHPVLIGVYAVGHPRLVGLGHMMAAVLACGDGALLSHRSAAALWGLLRGARSRTDVTVTARSRRGRVGINLHRVRTLHADDRAVVDGIPVTGVARTLLDLAEVIGAHRLERAFEEAERLRLLDIRALSRLCERSPGRHGVRPIRTLLLDTTGPVPDTRSELERRFAEFCHEARLPPPAFNVVVAGFEVDALWPDKRLIVELDGYAFHGNRAAFERDRVRDAALQAAGHRVLRLTFRRLTDDPSAVAETIRSLLIQDRPTPAAAPYSHPTVPDVTQTRVGG